MRPVVEPAFPERRGLDQHGGLATDKLAVGQNDGSPKTVKLFSGFKSAVLFSQSQTAVVEVD